jgi:pimeloyl-ACP methyl ester carboxylesterase
MTIATTLEPAPALAATGTGFSLVSSMTGAIRVLRNLSGFGRKSRLDRLLSPRAVAQRTELVSADGTTITVEVSGAGRPMLLIHGLGGSRHDWNATVERLARSHRVYTLDMGGHGSRAAANTRPTLQTMARDVALVIERLMIERPLLAGHSMGALVVMQYLREHGADRVGGVCFVDQSPLITTDAHWQLGLFGTLTREQLHGALVRLGADFVETVVSEAVARWSRFRGADRGVLGLMVRGLLGRFRDAMGVAPLLSILQSLAESDFRDVIGALSVPTLVVLGAQSKHYRGLPLADYYRSALANGSVTTFAACGHSPHRDEPARFAAELAAFAARLQD